MSARPRPPDDILARLLPRLQQVGPWTVRPLADEALGIGLVLPGDEGPVPVGPDDLAAWGLDADAAVEAALDNLRARSESSRWQAVHTVPGMQIYLPFAHDAAARALLLPELIDDFPLEGALFAVPTGNQLYVVPLRDVEHVQAMRVVVNATRVACRNSDEPLSDQLFWSDGQRIVHIQVTRADDDTRILAPPEFLDTVERLTALGWVGELAAEA